MTVIETPPPRSGVRLGPLLTTTALVALVIGFALGGWLMHHDGYISTDEGKEVTAKVAAVKEDSICLIRGNQAVCRLPLYAMGVNPQLGDTVKAVELEAKDDDGASSGVWYVLSEQ